MVVGLLVVILGIAGPSTLDAVSSARAGQRALEEAADAVGENDADRAERELATAFQELTDATNALSSSWTWLARTTPGVGRQYKAAGAIIRSAELLASAGSGPLGVLRAQPGGFSLRNGTLDLAALQRGAEALTNATPAAKEARQAIENAPRGWLLPPLAGARRGAEEEVVGAAEAIVKGAAGLRAAPTLLGADGPKRYIVLNSNLAELRGTGGILSYYALIQADRGRLSLLPDSGRTSRTLPTPSEAGVQPPKWYMDTWGQFAPLSTWPNINMTTDFPTAADIVVKTAATALGPLDGAIQVDPIGLAALLHLSGPLKIPEWPEQITSSNISQIAQHDAYVRYTDDEARDVLAERLIRAVFGRLIGRDLQPRLGRFQPLGDAVRNGHIKIYSTNTASQEQLAVAEIHGGLPNPGNADVLGVFNQNAGANKVDWFLRRSIHYEIRPGPDDTAFAILTVTLRNQAPAAGLPEYIIGPNAAGIAAGENRTILTVIRSQGSKLLTVRTEGASSLATIDQEKDLRAHKLSISVPAGESKTIEMVFVLDRALTEDYQFVLLSQPAVAQDVCSLTIRLLPPSQQPSNCS